MFEEASSIIHSWKDNLFGKATGSTLEPAESNDAAARAHREQSYSASQRARPARTSSDSTVAPLTDPVGTSARHRKESGRPSEHERRLLPNYEPRAKGTPIQPPDNSARQHTASSMSRKPKPGAASSFKPSNTIGHDYFSSPRAGSLDRTPEAVKKRQIVVAADGERVPAKRRRPLQDEGSEENSPVRRIMLDDASDNIQFVSAHNVQSGSASSPVQNRPASAKSQRSATSDSWGVSKGSQPVSEFQNVNAATAVRGKKSRDGSKVLPASASSRSFQSRLPPQTGNLISSPIVLIDNKGSSARRMSVPNVANQAVKRRHRLSTEDSESIDELQQTSPFFSPQTTGKSERINLSTTEKKSQQSGLPKDRLRRTMTFQQDRDVVPDPVSDGEDELHEGIKPSGRHNPSMAPKKSPPRPIKQSRSSIQGKAHSSEEGWLLDFMQTYDQQMRAPGLTLHRNASSNAFDVKHITESGLARTVCSIKLNNINQSLDDQTSRIRVIGSQNAQGERYWFDLDFVNRQDLTTFRDQYLTDLPGHKNYSKTDQFMSECFKKPYKRNNKIFNSANQDIDIELITKRAQSRSNTIDQRPARNGLMIDKLGYRIPAKSPRQDSRATRAEARASNRLEVSQSTTRPVRSTRSTRPIRYVDDEPEADISKQLSKYSVEVGLGPRWPKPLQYGVGRHRVLVDFDDLLRLDEGEFLNDNLVSFYMAYLYDQCGVPDGKVFRFNNFFYTSLTNVNKKGALIDYEAVRKWTKDEDIFTYDHIVVPICENLHWYLAIICNVSNIHRTLIIDESDDSPEPESKPGDRSAAPTVDLTEIPKLHEGTSETMPSDGDFNVFEHELKLENLGAGSDTDVPREEKKEDSVGSETTRMKKLSLDGAVPTSIMDNSSSPVSSKRRRRKSGPAQRKYNPENPVIVILDSMGASHPRAVKALKAYIQEEGKAKRGMDAVINENALNPKDNHIPQQDNFSDCGVYLLGYSQKFFQDPREFVVRLLTREMDCQTDWPEMNASSMRIQMRDILLKLGAQQREKDKRVHMEKKKAQGATPTPLNVAKACDASKPPLDSPTKDTAPVQPTSLAKPTHALDSSAPTVSERSPHDVVPPPGNSIASPKRLHAETTPDDIGEDLSSDRQARSNSPKKRKIEHAPAPLKKTRSSPRALRSPTVKRDPPQATGPKNANTQKQSLKQLRGSSTDPIEIDDSQDTIQPKLGPPSEASTKDVQSTARAEERGGGGFVGDDLLHQLADASRISFNETNQAVPENDDESFEGIDEDDRGLVVPETPEPEEQQGTGEWQQGGPLPM